MITHRHDVCDHFCLSFCLWWTCLHCSYNESCTCILPAAVNCGPAPNAPANGQRSGSGTTFRSTVTYTCNPGYTLKGSSRLTCTHLQLWSGRVPTCNRKLLAVRWHFIGIIRPSEQWCCSVITVGGVSTVTRLYRAKVHEQVKNNNRNSYAFFISLTRTDSLNWVQWLRFFL